MSLLRNRYFLICFLFSAVIFLFSAWLNNLYIHPDELFQVVEFASYKMGITGASQLSWEFHEKMRPGFQPFLCYIIFKALIKAGITDHYTHLLVLRLLSACLTLFATTLFCSANINYTIGEKYRKFYVLATFLFWMPYFYGVHFSSETWAGDFVLIALSVWLLCEQGRFNKYTSVPSYVIGLLLGVAFLFRFQSVFFTIGFAGWLIFIRREKFSILLYIITGGITALFIGTLADRWLYGEWVFTPWCYFEGNIIKGMASHFGTAPFYSYLLWILLYPSPVIGIVILAAFAVLLVKLPRNIYTWILFPFLIGHSVVAHKEWRFLFPSLGFVPVVVVLAYQTFNKPSTSNRYIKPTLIASLLFSNFLMLFIFVFFASRYGNNSKLFAQRLHEMAKHGKLKIYYYNAEADPFILPKGGIDKEVFPEYLREQNIANIKFEVPSPYDTTFSEGVTNLIVGNFYELKHSPWLSANGNCEIEMRSFPAFIEKFLSDNEKRELEENTFVILRVKN